MNPVLQCSTLILFINISAPVRGEFLTVMETLKKVESPICSVDIPSGKHNNGASVYYQISFWKRIQFWNVARFMNSLTCKVSEAHVNFARDPKYS